MTMQTNKTTKLPSAKCTPQELEVFKGAADDCEMSFSDFCRFALLAATEDPAEVMRRKSVDASNKLLHKMWGDSLHKPAEFQ